VGLQRHHHAGYQEAIRRIHDGELGDITSMRAYWNGGGVWDPRATREQVKSEMEYQLRNWYYYVWLCGDHITEQHIHNLDIMNWVKQGVNSGNDPIHPLLKSVQAGFPILAEGMGGRQVRIDKKYGEIFDHHFVEFTYADGSKGYSQCRHIRGCKNSVNEYATGTKGRAFVSRQRFFSHKGELGWSFGGGAKNAYQVEHDRLFAAIRENQPHVEAEYGAMSTMTSILGRLATYTGQGLKMADVLKSEKVLMPDDIAYEKGVWKGTPPSLPDKDGVYPVAVPGNSEWIKKLI
jgi:predicted dehydrogenase